MLKLINEVFVNKDRGYFTGVVFLDLKKIFNTVDTEILIQKSSLSDFTLLTTSEVHDLIQKSPNKSCPIGPITADLFKTTLLPTHRDCKSVSSDWLLPLILEACSVVLHP